ncbi:hypothetical protein SAMN04487939_11557 [Lysobacter sp. yr284]|uniref:hypothetical protein n=1 Tax=Lysobacter sp. yr284 TaxID=1761791 RepID=UPI000898DE9C|nr:hypothetical protein [Lysobacter sp. yr284]SDZ08809.1 hypothetical protein SAMN04487939_11557 [Lysobacter sp. yr284]
MTAARALRLGLGSLLLLAVAAAAFVATNWTGGELAAALGLPPGGIARLGWDLAWTVAAAALALWIVARWAPVAARAQAALAWLALATMAVWAVANLGGEFPLWFDAGLLAALPVLGFGAWRWAGASRLYQERRA